MLMSSRIAGGKKSFASFARPLKRYKNKYAKIAFRNYEDRGVSSKNGFFIILRKFHNVFQHDLLQKRNPCNARV